MKKICTLLLAFLFAFSFNFVYAADEYAFDLTYEGTIVANEEKSATVELIGTNGTTYSNVRIKVDIEGPATPTIFAYDSAGTKINIAEEGYWGPTEGFAVTGTFTNTTPIQATFTKAGTYTITLSLINVQDNNAVITTKNFTLEVLEEAATDNTTTAEDEDNLVEEENQVEEIPKTGRSVKFYAEVGVFVLAMISFGVVAYKKKIS